MNVKREKLKISRQYKKNLANPRAILVCPKTWCVRFDISPLDLMIFEEIHSATWNFTSGAYTGSRVGLCSIVNASLPTIDKTLDLLEEKGFIRKEFKVMASIRGEKKIVAYCSMIPRDVPINDNKLEEILETNQTRNMTRARRAK